MAVMACNDFIDYVLQNAAGGAMGENANFDAHSGKHFN